MKGFKKRWGKQELGRGDRRRGWICNLHVELQRLESFAT